MNKRTQQPVVIKKYKKHQHASHGGSWKIAYADFMTAMMALFLVMWLMVSITPEQRQQLAGYFNSSSDIFPSAGEKERDLSDSIIPMAGGEIINPQTNLPEHMQSSDAENLANVRHELEDLIQTDPRLNNLKSNLLLTINDSGLLIQIIDSQDRPMFMLGSKKPEHYMVGILQALVPLLNEIPYRLTITGHTDSLPFANGGSGYSNWELSADRANAARQVMVSDGLKKDKVLQVIGMASNMAIDSADPEQAINRRISILILNRNKEREALQDGEAVKAWLKSRDNPQLEKEIKLNEHRGL